MSEESEMTIEELKAPGGLRKALDRVVQGKSTMVTQKGKRYVVIRPDDGDDPVDDNEPKRLVPKEVDV